MPRKPAVPFAMQHPDRVPKQRYYDPDFFHLEVEQLWSRVWQMACRLDQIPNVGDAAEYELLDETVIVIRTDEGIRAFQNACRHRGVRLVVGQDHCENGFTCPFHGWCYGTDGINTFVPRPSTFAEHNARSKDLDLVPVRCEVWGGCAWINFDDSAPPLRDCIEPVATVLDAWKIESLHAEWWQSFRLPVNWKLAEEAFMEQYHVLETHPQLRIPGRYPGRDGSFDAKVFKESELHYLRMMSQGMDGMVHANDLAIAEKLKRMRLPADAMEARQVWDTKLNAAVTKWHRERGSDVPDLNELEAAGMNEPMGYAFPHFFVLPMYSSASGYRFRPLAPEETLMEIWSLTRYPEGEAPPTLPIPVPWDCADPRTPPIPIQDFSNLPRQQRGLHTKDFEYMRLSAEIEGHIGNYHRVLDGFLAGLPYDQLLPALQHINVNPLERSIVDVGL